MTLLDDLQFEAKNTDPVDPAKPEKVPAGILATAGEVSSLAGNIQDLLDSMSVTTKPVLFFKDGFIA
jgi:hypothetical protein